MPKKKRLHIEIICTAYEHDEPAVLAAISDACNHMRRGNLIEGSELATSTIPDEPEITIVESELDAAIEGTAPGHAEG